MTGNSTAPADKIELELLLDVIYRRYGYDFRQYSQPSLNRRLCAARDRFGCRSFSELRQKLLDQELPFAKLLTCLTVQVSDMFRDPAFFRCLREEVVPHLKTYPFVRVWAAGCSTGEEVYSLAILFREEGLESRSRFYATDIDSSALRQAETGIYPLDRIACFSNNHQLSGARCSLSDYYTAHYNAAIFDKTLRRHTVFADHSLVSDSVFAEMHLVVCRNVLIYFTRPLQARAVGLFRDALVRKGFLALGAKENLHFNAHAAAFEDFAAAQRVYRKRGGE